ncbi:unnamed protein product [Schistocephalus solidus]|uniref:Reverse transcriptase domain-containing protein n=1 Tax=Schistocephalus solidus TaxID=70667 RepID=A0A183TQY8_SCHSO|nr:unnamed protein product [Schistocephalus solidus]
MYADDLKVAYRYKPVDRHIVLELLKKDLQAFAQWCHTWRLSLSWHKCSVMDTFHEFWVLILWKLSSVLMASTDSESYAGLHAEGNIAGSAVRNRQLGAGVFDPQIRKALLQDWLSKLEKALALAREEEVLQAACEQPPQSLFLFAAIKPHSFQNAATQTPWQPWSYGSSPLRNNCHRP